MEDAVSFEHGATVTALRDDAAHSGRGRLVSVRTDVYVDHGDGDHEDLLLMEVELAEPTPEGDLVLWLARPGFGALHPPDSLVDALSATAPDVYFVASEYELPPGPQMRSRTGSPPAAPILSTSHSAFPMVVGLTAEGTAATLFTSERLAPTEANLVPLREVGFDVTSFTSLVA